MKMTSIKQLLIPALTLIVGLGAGLGVGQMQVSNEQKLCQSKIKEKDKKIAFIQKKMTEEKTEATGSLEIRFRDELNKIQADLESEKKKATALTGRAGKLNDQIQKMGVRIKEADESTAKTKQELQEAIQSNKELDRELKKTSNEKQALQAELKKTTRDLGTCYSNNVELVKIAQELVKKYKEKGFGAVLLEKEPLTQVKKVELENLTSQYQEEIDKRNITKK